MIQANRLFFASCLSLLVTSMIFSIRADVLQMVRKNHGRPATPIGQQQHALGVHRRLDVHS